jgi:NADPH:quinone reductase-like Zn-dependent oxidoreductase
MSSGRTHRHPGCVRRQDPRRVEVETARALDPAATAPHDAVEAIAPKEGDAMLVSGATGDVGVIATPLLKARGA